MARRMLFVPLVLVMVAGVAVSAYFHWRVVSPVTIGREVGTYFHDPRPEVAYVATRTDSTYEPMYLINIRGHFLMGGRHADLIRFSVLANGTYIWSMAVEAGGRQLGYPGCPGYWGMFAYRPPSRIIDFGW